MGRTFMIPVAPAVRDLLTMLNDGVPLDPELEVEGNFFIWEKGGQRHVFAHDSPAMERWNEKFGTVVKLLSFPESVH